MSEADDSSLQKAEGVVKRVLERLGSAVDKKLHAEKDREVLTSHQVSDLISLLESAVQAELRADSNGVRRIAPNRFKVLLTYEKGGHLSEPYKQELAHALGNEVYEFIHNRRYEILASVHLEIGADLFAKTPVIKCSFENDPAEGATDQNLGPSGPAPGARSVDLESSGAKLFHLDLTPGSDPVYIGRGAGTAIRIDDSSVSRLHASIAMRSDGEIVVCDLGSVNGTYLNGHIVNKGETAQLKMGDVITIGEERITVRSLE